jgi:hypothetical protein
VDIDGSKSSAVSACPTSVLDEAVAKGVSNVKVGKPKKITIVTPKENPVPSTLPPLTEPEPLSVP